MSLDAAARLSSHGTEASLTYRDTEDPQLHFVRLDAQGQPRDAGSTLGDPGAYATGVLIPSGDDDLVVLGTWSGVTDQYVAFEFTHVSSGAFVAAPSRITRDEGPLKSVQTARMGADAIVGWLASDRVPARLGLARIAL